MGQENIIRYLISALSLGNAQLLAKGNNIKRDEYMFIPLYDKEYRRIILKSLAYDSFKKENLIGGFTFEEREYLTKPKNS